MSVPGSLPISHTSLLVLIQLIISDWGKNVRPVYSFGSLKSNPVVVFWIAGGLSWSMWISISTLLGGRVVGVS